jgi:hypothetical protein
MKETWQLNELREYIDRKYGVISRERETLDSLARYDGLFVYHIQTARDGMKGIIENSTEFTLTNVEYALGVSSRQKEFYKAMLVSEANMLACIHAVRALYEVFAQLVNFLLLNELLTVKECNLHKVTEKLHDSELKSLLEELLKYDEYVYVAAFVNTAKHRYLVGQVLNVEANSGNAELFVREFEYGCTKFDRRSFANTLIGAIAVKNRVIRCGQVLNAMIGVKP